MKLYSFAGMMLIAATTDSCGSASSDHADSQKVNEQQKVYAQTQPVPFFKWSQDRDNLIQIYKQKNDSRSTYAVVRSFGTGDILWHCPSIGFPIPADTQLTNPLHPINDYSQASIVEQAEPNGLYTSKNTDGTYVLCVDKDGAISPQYTEEKVEAFTRPVKVDDGKVVFLNGKPSMNVKLNKGKVK